MPVLYLHESEPALDEALDYAAREAGVGRSAVEVGSGQSSVPRLVADATLGTGLGRLGESLTLLTLAGDELAPRTALDLRAPLASLRRAGISPSALRSASQQIIGDGAAKARRLAHWLERYEAQLGERRDPARVEREALSHLATAPLANLAEVEAVVLAAPPAGPLARAVIDALIARGIAVRCHAYEAAVEVEVTGVAAVHAERLAEAVAESLSALEAIDARGAAAVEAVTTPLGAGPVAEIVSGGSPVLEAREVARRVRDHVHAGHAPDSVIVVADEPARRALLADALRRYELPVEVAHESHALDAEAVRVVPALLELADEDVPRDRLVDLLSSRYVAGGIARGELPRGVSGGRVARAVRELAPASAHAADYPRAFAPWLAGADARKRIIAAHVIDLVAAVGALPAQATMVRHTAALRRLLDRLHLFARARRVANLAPPGPETRAAHALLRDQAGLRRLEDLLDALPRTAAQAGLATRSFSRQALMSLLLEELGAASLSRGGGHGAVVRVCAPRDLVPHAGAFLVLSGAEEGSLPRSGREHPLVPDDLAHVLERALDRKIFASTRERDRGAVLAIARARARASHLIVSYARADADGRPLFAGALVEHAEAVGGRVHRAALDSVPRLRDARTFEELSARLLVERSGDESAREGLAPRTLDALSARLDGLDQVRLTRILGLSAIERGRADFFARRQPPGVFDGRLSHAPPVDSLPGSSARPLSASTLGRYAECPHRFFLESVLRLRALEELGDDLDEPAAGSLAHAALERLFTAWRDAKLFPLRGRAEEQALIAPAANAAASAFRAEDPSGHEVLFRGRTRALVRMLEAVWRKEVDDPPAAGFEPRGFEHAFDGLTMPTEGAPIHLAGTIDRFDVQRDGEQVAVFDYKSGRLRELTADLKPDAFGETSWQLPLYAAAMRATSGARELSLNYYSLRDVKVGSVVAPDWLVLDAGSEAQPTLGDRLRARVGDMRAGRFDVEPRAGACDRCRMQAVCRVRPRRDDNEERR